MYSTFSRKPGGEESDWYFWGILAAVSINSGLFLLLSAFVHKVKSDFIKRQKQREQQKTFTED
jgi:ABC-type nickel/cobalt efflux system permease component RcnA